MSALDLVHVGKNYGSSCVLSDISFSVTEGDFLGLLGHNGAGKSTLIEIIVGLVEKTSGRVAVFGKDLDREPLLAKSCIGFVSQDYNFNQFDTVMQVVVNQAGLYGIPYRTAVQRAKKYLDILQLSDRSKEQTRFLSGGMKKRMMLARAVIHQPKLLILDELTSGVDIEVRYLIWNFLRELNRSGTTIIMITHYLEEIENLCNRVVILNSGKIADIDSVENLQKKLISFDLSVTVSEIISPEMLQDLNVRITGDSSFEIKMDLSKENYNDLLQKLASRGLKVVNLKEKASRLEQYFMHLRETEKINDP